MKWIAPHGATSASERYVNAQPTIAGSNPDAEFFNTVLDELLAVIVAADMTPTDANLHQIADAIEYLTERAATSGVTKGAYWFGKTTANFTVPNPTLPEQNYIDFTTLKTYSAKSDLSGWTQTGTFVPPVGIDFTILITSKFWDIPEQSGQQGGEAKYNHTDQVWSYWPKIISFQDAALTGTPTAPTPAAGNSSTRIATTKFVADSFAPLASPALTGTPTAPTPAAGNSSTRIATTKFVADSFAPKASPAFTGTPTAPTVSSITDNSTKLATTKFVLDALKAIYPVDSIYIGTGSTCPLASLFGTWTRIDAGLALWTGNGTKGNGSTVSTTSTGATNKISAGSPNITGAVSGIGSGLTHTYSGAFKQNAMDGGTFAAGGGGNHITLGFDASRSSSIYGNSTTVQPPAYVVNVWRRTA